MLRLVLVRLFCAIGKYLFPMAAVWCNEKGEPRVYWFSDSLRDLNSGTRDYVDDLDESYR